MEVYGAKTARRGSSSSVRATKAEKKRDEQQHQSIHFTCQKYAGAFLVFPVSVEGRRASAPPETGTGSAASKL